MAVNSSNNNNYHKRQTSLIPHIHVSKVQDDDPYSTPLASLNRAPRMMRRAGVLRVVTRKTTIAIAALVVLLLLLFRNSNTLPSSSTWATTSVFDCPSNRTNPFRIKPPQPADALQLSRLWYETKNLFDANVPQPDLEHPRHKGPDPPKKEDLGKFFALTNEDAATTRNRHATVVKNIPSYPRSTFSGRGIVMLAGGRYSEFAATSLGMIREMQSKLPVEVWIKDEEEDMPGWCDELALEGMACRRLSDYMDVGDLKHAYALKVFTMLFSSFNEILFLDADSCPIANPDRVFESKQYKDNGAILWPDYWMHTGSPWAPYLTGITEGQSEMMMDRKSIESGQIVWHKQRHWKSLMLAVYYNYFGPQFWYTIQNNGWAGWGDKDTFPMALEALKEPYFQVKHGIVTTFVDGTVHGIGMMQADPANLTHHNPLFLHSNIIKWSMRNLACKKCDDIPGHEPHYYHLEDEHSSIHKHLIEAQRIFGMTQMDEHSIDPEPIMWKAIEWTACHSDVWGNDQVCSQTRYYMERALGFEFRKSRLASAVGNGNIQCMYEPARFKRNRPRKEKS